MKKFGLFAIALLIAVFSFTSCKPASSFSSSLEVEGGENGVIYTTVSYDNIEIKASWSEAVKDDTQKTDIQLMVFLGNEVKYDEDGAVDLDASNIYDPDFTNYEANLTLNEDKKSLVFKSTSNSKSATDVLLVKELESAKSGKFIVIIPKDAFEPAKDKDVVIVSGPSKIKDRSATVTCDNISWKVANTIDESNPAPSVTATITLTGCKIAVAKDAFEGAKNVTGAIKVKVGEAEPAALPSGITAELVAKDKDADTDEANNCIKSTNTFQVKITGAAEITAQEKGKLVITLPSAAIDGYNLVIETDVTLEVTETAPAQD